MESDERLRKKLLHSFLKDDKKPTDSTSYDEFILANPIIPGGGNDHMIVQVDSEPEENNHEVVHEEEEYDVLPIQQQPRVLEESNDEPLCEIIYNQPNSSSVLYNSIKNSAHIKFGDEKRICLFSV